MDDNFDKAAIAVIIVFGALIIGGLMAANLVMGHRNGFLYALGAAGTAWIAGHMILFDLPRAYAFMVAASFLLAFASTLSLVT
ncbi:MULTISPECIES: hypothetical protein [Phyllobacteriaceae]|jgi:hypothetical protein|uniref:GGDEF domain-containing protein n=1 Tax=Mesorhizobium hungaricum TaxID=1566387 RepID=A0A1C2DP61_9HYPH|nr:MULTISPECIES: hypothetical protein [Mesorhizobium]MBN9233532.1 hypothetical protein [Mesorhizobium sp.]MDQ0328662.1 hypothetical protein [Mesorhizobium sp. YL-MeA3-2017]OCX16529.1 hypothetical protein QV13_17165 [Mesorhizobium hungaricum]